MGNEYNAKRTFSLFLFVALLVDVFIFKNASLVVFYASLGVEILLVPIVFRCYKLVLMSDSIIFYKFPKERTEIKLCDIQSVKVDKWRVYMAVLGPVAIMTVHFKNNETYGYDIVKIENEEFYQAIRNMFKEHNIDLQIDR